MLSLFLEFEPRHGVSMTAHVAWSTIFFAVQKAYGMLWRNATMSQSHKTRPSPWRTWMVTSLSWAQNWSIPQKTGRRYRHGWLKRLKCSNPVLNPKKNCVIPFSLPDRDCRCCGALGWPCHGWLWEESWKKRTIKAEGNGLPMFSIFFSPKIILHAVLTIFQSIPLSPARNLLREINQRWWSYCRYAA